MEESEEAEYLITEVVKDITIGCEKIVERIVTCADPCVEIWLNIDEYPNLLSVRRIK